MTQLEFLAALPLYRAAWVRKVRGRLARKSAIGATETAEDIVCKAIAELSTANRYESIKGPADITKRIEYRLRDFLDHTHAELPLLSAEGDDSEAHRFKSGKTTVSWVMAETEDYQRHLDIRDALASLPHRERYVAAMIWVEGLSQEDVAARLCVHQTTVTRLLDKVKASLRIKLADYGGI